MAIAPSPAPRPRSRGRIAAVAVGLGLLALIGAGILLAPRVLRPMAAEELVERLRKRLDTSVEIETVDLRWVEVELQGVEIGGGDDPRLIFDHILVTVEEDALWDLRVVAKHVAVTGGSIRGSTLR